jgi:hypothetical protein
MQEKGLGTHITYSSILRSHGHLGPMSEHNPKKSSDIRSNIRLFSVSDRISGNSNPVSGRILDIKRAEYPLHPKC